MHVAQMAIVMLATDLTLVVLHDTHVLHLLQETHSAMYVACLLAGVETRVV